MSVDTFEQPASAGAPGTPPTADEPATVNDVDALTEAIRSLMVRAKNRHRTIEQTSDHGRIAILFVLARHGDMRASALAKEVSLDLSTVSRHLRTLEDEGQVAKSADPDDKRASQVGLTPRGRDFVREFWRHRVTSVHSALSEWSGDEVRALTELLDRFVRDTEGCI
ncbi:MAG: MarR family winged helix-turn-helix transcriptional regulator [Actinocrinis sp.]